MKSKVINLGRTLYLSHHIFGNDIILLCDGSRRHTLTLKENIYLYLYVTRMKFNLVDLRVYFFGVNEDDVIFFTRLFPNFPNFQ